VSDDILNEIIGCEHGGTCNHQCTTAFRLISDELQFYRRMKLPLPRRCPNCRYAERMQRTNPVELWHRKCMCAGSTSSPQAGRKSEAWDSKSEAFVYENTATHFHGEEVCPNEFETSYSPDRPEIVYCESCYNTEVV
jgi:hypothetical protein